MNVNYVPLKNKDVNACLTLLSRLDNKVSHTPVMAGVAYVNFAFIYRQVLHRQFMYNIITTNMTA